MRNKGFNAPYFKSSVDKQKELFNIVNNVPHLRNFSLGKLHSHIGLSLTME